MIITIDGPMASGKSTAASMLAKKLDFFYIASGLLFRGLAYILMKNFGYNQNTIANPVKADILAGLDYERFAYSFDNKMGEKIYFDGVDITSFLKTSIIDTAASIMSTNAQVREELLNYQRALAINHDIVIDGRDCGSVVFVHADFKFYLTASLEVRALRWTALQKSLGNNITLQEAQEHIASRDLRDSQRALDPLVIPQEAIIIDNSDLNQEQVADKMLAIITP